MGDIFYFNKINEIGGVENFFYQIAKNYKDRNITIIYKTGDIKQVERYKKYVRVIKYRYEKIKCRKAYFNYNPDIIENVEADEYIGLIHADYKNIPQKPSTHPKITRYIAVSETARKNFIEITGINCDLIYNPCEIEKPKRVLNLISATRLTNEKGKDRMIKLGEALNRAGIPYVWLVFTNDRNVIENQNIVYMKPRFDIINYIANADYLVQLSSAESYCYSIVEALSVKTPVIVTDLPVLKEIGANNNNSIILDFNMTNIDIDKIYNKKFNFEYEAPKSEWDKELTTEKSIYQEEIKATYIVEATENWDKKKIMSIELGIVPKKGDKWQVNRQRLEALLDNNNDLINTYETIC